MRSAITAAPDLRTIRRTRPKQDQAGIGELARPSRWAPQLSTLTEGSTQVSLDSPANGWPPTGRGQQVRTCGKDGGPGVLLRVVHQESPSLVAISLAWRTSFAVQDPGGGVEHP